jgi:HTH-type transcriptional regulator / antitoxin HigA
VEIFYLQNEYPCRSAWAPGVTLLDELDEKGMSQTELAERMGCSFQTINEIIQGKGAITSEMACQLEQILEVPAYFWIKREQSYREYLACLAEDPQLVEWVKWLERLPVQEMIRQGWIRACESETQQVFEVLRFFEIACPSTWKVRGDAQIAKCPRKHKPIGLLPICLLTEPNGNSL